MPALCSRGVFGVPVNVVCELINGSYSRGIRAGYGASGTDSTAVNFAVTSTNDDATVGQG